MDRILGRFSIGLKLGGSFFFIIILIAVTLSLSYSDLKQLNLGMASMYHDHTIPIQNLSEARALVGRIKSNIQLNLQIPKPEAEDEKTNGHRIAIPAMCSRQADIIM